MEDVLPQATLRFVSKFLTRLVGVIRYPNNFDQFFRTNFETYQSQVKQQPDQVHKENTLDQLVSWLTMKFVKKLTRKDGLSNTMIT